MGLTTGNCVLAMFVLQVVGWRFFAAGVNHILTREVILFILCWML